eukprot:scaffold112989_cov37-Attheya_sp.AAC.1
MFKSVMIIKNIDQANAANHLECIHIFLRDRESLQTIEGCTAFNLASPDVNSVSPFMRAFLPHKNGIFSRSSAQKRLKVWGNYMRDTHGSVSTVPADKRSPSSFPLSPFVYTAPTNLENVLPASEERLAKDNDSAGSQSTRDSTIPRSIQHSTANQDVNYHDEAALEAGLPDTHRRSSRIPDNSQTLVPHPLICQIPSITMRIPRPKEKTDLIS